MEELMEKINSMVGNQPTDCGYDDDYFLNLQVKRLNETQGSLKGYDCPKCNNKGFIYLALNGNLTTDMCDCMVVRNFHDKVKRSGLSNLLDKYTFDKYQVTEDWQKYIKDKATAFINDESSNWFFIGGQVGCVDCDTEYFNGTEWKRIADYTEGEKVLQYEPTTKKATMTLPKDYIKRDADVLYKISTERGHIDMVLSDNHNFAYVTTKGHMQKKPFREVMKMHEETTQGFYGKIETAFSYSGKGIDLTENEIRLMCVVMADGSFRKGLRLCTVNIKKERKKERLRELLKNQEYKEYQKKDGYSQFRFYAPRREKEFTEFWYDCNYEQLQVIVDEVFHWDGSIRGNRQSFYSTSKRSADFIQFALSSTGSRATVGVDNRKEKPCYTVIKTSHRSTVTMCSTGGKNKAKIECYTPKDKKQYCFTVETGYLVLRRNGRIFITGNSGKTHICTAMANEYLKNRKAVVYIVWTDEIPTLNAIVNNNEEYQAKMKEFKTAPVLYIDDFFRVEDGQKVTPAEIKRAFELLNYRYNNPELITIISSQLTIREIIGLSEAVGSRINELTKDYQINIAPDMSRNYRLR